MDRLDHVDKAAMGQETEYLIGDVSAMAGITRDALRFYEKKGVISARKKENGYRYYSQEDIFRLMYILYYRKMNTSLEEIEGLMSGRRSVPFLRKYLKQRMAEEKEAVRRHQQAITRLRLVEKDVTRIEESLNRYSVRNFPSSYIMGHCPNLQEALKEWFRLSGAINGLDMTYFYNTLLYTKKGLVQGETRLLLYKGLEPDIGNGFDPERYPLTKEVQCLYTVVESGVTLPDFDTVYRMAQWGRQNGLELENVVYANDMTSFFGEEGNTYCVELYMPVKKEKPQPRP